MTLEERVAALEAKTQDFLAREMNVGGTIPFEQVNANVGLFSRFWGVKPIGEGAALAVGCNGHRFAIYAAVDVGPDGFAPCPDHPTTAVYAESVSPHRPAEHQPNIGVESHAANSPYGNIPFYGTYQYAPQSPIGTPTEGIRLDEVDASGTVLRSVSISASGITIRSGSQPAGPFNVIRNGQVLATL